MTHSSLNGKQILVIDDHANIRLSVRLTLEGQGAKVEECSSVTSAQKLLRPYILPPEASDERQERFPYSCILLDIRLPDGSGLDLLKQLSGSPISRRVIMISGEGSAQDAFLATKMGAFDYIEKPFGEERLLVSVGRCIDYNRISDEASLLAQKAQGGDLLGTHPLMLQVHKLIKRVAPTSGRVLITGESGTGKELVARSIHRQSGRASAPLIKINCAAIAPSLIESELFGHEKGAFTGAIKERRGVFERADGGTLFLDEIGEISLETQAKLLRVLQNGELQRVGGDATIKVDVRLIAATNRNLADMVANGEFREDLFYRLNVLTIELPPLRARASDIEILAKCFLEETRLEHALEPKEFSAAALQEMMQHPWPGNVRELKNAIERAAILSDESTIDHILDIKAATPQKTLEKKGETGEFLFHCTELSWQDFHDQAGTEYLKFTLRKTSGNVSEAARLLCLERAYLHRLMKKLGIQRDVTVT